MIQTHRLLTNTPEETQAVGHALGAHAKAGDIFLLTCPGLMEQVLALLPQPVAVVGEVVAGKPGQVSILDVHGQEVAAGSSGSGGWDHFG